VSFVSRAARTGRWAASLNDVEVALLEILDEWSKVIEAPLPQAWKRLLEVVSDERVRPERLTRAARTEPAPARARLAALLDDAGFSELAGAVPMRATRTSQAALGELAAVR
jgi:hypothetical protein